MKKWFVGLMMLLALVLMQSTAMAFYKDAICPQCKVEREFVRTDDYCWIPKEDMHMRVYRCPVCDRRQGMGTMSPHVESKPATCVSGAYCALCKTYRAATDPNNHTYTIVYNKVDDKNHIKKEVCSGCKKLNTSLTEQHRQKEAATCVSGAICADCGEAYGSPIPNAHNWTEWQPHMSLPNVHYRYCQNAGCSAYETEAHDGNSNCVTMATCSKCNATYKDTTNHAGPLTYTYEKENDNFHKKIESCTACGKRTGSFVSTKHVEKYPANCTYAAFCAVCESYYGGINPDNHDWNKWVCKDENQHYRICKNNDEHIQFADHRGYATCIVTMTCLDCQQPYNDPDKHQGPYTYVYAASASSASKHTVTETCTACGKISRTYDEDHDLELHAAQAPTCFHVGWNAYEACQNEGCGYTTYVEIPRLVHWYAEWTPNADATHTASCKRGCRYQKAVSCTQITIALPTGDEHVEITLCPVCGEVSDGTRLMLTEAAATAVTGKLPAGEVVVRMGTLENGEAVLSVAFEIGGRLTQPAGQVKITLPAELLAGYTLSLLSGDGAEAPIESVIEEDIASFTLDFTESQTPSRLLRLVPQA